MAKKTEEVEQRKMIDKVNRKTVKIVLKRLTPEEIDQYCRIKKKTRKEKMQNQFTMKLRKR